MRHFRLFIWVAIMIELLLPVQPALSQEEATAPSKTVEEKFDDLDQKVRILERRFELQQEGAAEKAKEAPGVVSGKDGFSLKSADGQFQLKLRGLIHVDTRILKPDTNTFLLRRVRPILEGTVYKIFDFRFTPDFGGGTTAIQDAFLNIRFLPETKLQIGKFKPPVGLERLQSASDIRFVERALPTNLVPNRDIGYQLHGDLYEEAFSYAVGVFNGVPDGGSADIDADENKDIAGRIFIHPFKKVSFEPLQGFGIGFAASRGSVNGTPAAPALPSYRTPAQQTFFRYRTAPTGTAAAAANTAVADGVLLRTSPQAYYYWGPFGLLGEYVLSSQEVTLGATSEKLKNKAWQVSGYYLLTGEKESFKGVTPFRPFDPSQGRWGAFELAARYSVLKVDEAAFPTFANPASSAQEAKAWAGGVNWYLNRGVKFVINYELTKFEGGAAAGEDREKEKAILGRTQIAF